MRISITAILLIIILCGENCVIFRGIKVVNIPIFIYLYLYTIMVNYFKTPNKYWKITNSCVKKRLKVVFFIFFLYTYFSTLNLIGVCNIFTEIFWLDTKFTNRLHKYAHSWNYCNTSSIFFSPLKCKFDKNFGKDDVSMLGPATKYFYSLAEMTSVLLVQLVQYKNSPMTDSLQWQHIGPV